MARREIQGFKLNPTLGWQSSRELCRFHSHVCSAGITSRVDWLICSLVAPKPGSSHDKEPGSSHDKEPGSSHDKEPGSFAGFSTLTLSCLFPSVSVSVRRIS